MVKSSTSVTSCIVALVVASAIAIAGYPAVATGGLLLVAGCLVVVGRRWRLIKKGSGRALTRRRVSANRLPGDGTVRAVFLVSIMVLSLIAVGASAGAVAVTETNETAVAIQHAESSAGGTGAGTADGWAFAEVLNVESADGEPLSFGSDVDRSLRIRNTETGASVVLSPEDGEGTYDADRISIGIYRGTGELRQTPRVSLSGSEVEDGPQRINVSVTGDEDTFNGSARTFSTFAIDLLDGDGEEIDSTDERLIGVGYDFWAEQEGSEDEITLTLPRDPDVDESWFASVILHGTDVESTVDHDAGDEFFTVTLNVSDLPDGEYTGSLRLYPEESASLGERIVSLGLFGPNSVIVGSMNGTVTGAVTDPDDDGIENASITAFDDAGDDVAATTTASDGTYQFDLPRGTYELLVAHDGFHDETVSHVHVSVNETTVEDVVLTPDWNATNETADAIQHAGSGTTGGGTADGMAFAGVLSIESVDWKPLSFGSDVDRSLRVRNTETGASVELSPEDGEGTYDAERIRIEVYNGFGELRQTPRVSLLGGEVDDGRQRINVSIAGDVDTFNGSASTFSTFAIDLLDGDGEVIDSTDERLIGVGYDFWAEQEGSEDEITLTLPRDPDVDESWFASVVLHGTDVETTIDHDAGDEFFTATLDVSDLSDGEYSGSLRLYPDENASHGERILSLGLFGQNSVVVGSTNGTVTGAVTDPDDDGIDNASITAFDDAGDAVAVTTTASDGTYQFDLPRGTYELLVAHDEFQDETVDYVRVSVNETTVEDVVLTPDWYATIAGTVIDATSSEPIEGANVVLFEDTGDGDDEYVDNAPTNVDGEYELSVAPGEYIVRMYASGYGYGIKQTTVSIEEDETKIVDFSLEEMYEFTLAVNETDVSVGETIAVDGEFENIGDELIEWTFILTIDGFLVDDPVPFEVEPGETESVTFEYTLTEPGEFTPAISGYDADTVTVTGDEPVPENESVTITGVVELADGSPAAEDRLVIPGSDTGSITTDEDGSFEVELEQNSSYALGYWSYDASGFAPVMDGGPDIYFVDRITVDDEDRNLGTITLPEAHVLNVRVVDQDGDPVEGSMIWVLSYWSEESPNYFGTGSATTNADGYLDFESFDGTGIEVTDAVGVQVSPPEDDDRFVDTEYEEFVVVDGEKNLTVTLEESAPEVQLSGQILLADGSPAANDTIHVPGVDRIVTDEQGSFTVDVPRDTSHSLGYYRNDDSGKFAPVLDGSPDLYHLGRYEVEDEDVDLGVIHLPNASEVDILVEDWTGSPVADAHVRIFSSRDEPGGGFFTGKRTNADGFVAFQSANTTGINLVGPVVIEVEPPEGTDEFDERAYTKELVVESDDLLTFTLEEGTPEVPDRNATIAGTVLDAASNEPLDGAAVVLYEAIEGEDDEFVNHTLTNTDGEYELSVAPGEYIVRTFAVGYTYEEFNVSIDEDQTKTVDASLEKVYKFTLAVNETDVSVGETITVGGELENVGNESLEEEFVFTINGSPVDEVDRVPFEVEPGETESVTFEYTFTESGEFTPGISGHDADTVTVAPAEPSIADYANDDDVVTTDGLRDAVDDWRAGEVDTDLLRDVVDYWRSGDEVS